MGKLVNGDFIGTLIGFVMWLFASVGVLMMMDLMECFLHALRLHWVEFNNKFFKGDGYLFRPFCFSRNAMDLMEIEKELLPKKP